MEYYMSDEAPQVEFVTIESTCSPLGYAVMACAEEETVVTVFHQRMKDAKEEAQKMREVFGV